MAVKHLFIPLEAFIAQVAVTEVGVMKDVAVAYLKGIADKWHPYEHAKYKDMYFLPYPFQTSFTAHCIDYCADRDEVTAFYTKWSEENGATMTEDSVLPIKYDSYHTFGNMYNGRLEALLRNAITREDMEISGDMPVIVNVDRNNFIFVKGDHELINPGCVILRTSTLKNFIAKVKDTAFCEPGMIFQTALNADPTCGGECGKIMVGGPYTKYGRHCREYLMHIREETAQHYYEGTGVDISGELIMADFGDFEVCPHDSCPHYEECPSPTRCTGFIDPHMTREEVIHALAHPFDRNCGMIPGEKFNAGTTVFLSPWHEY